MRSVMAMKNMENKAREITGGRLSQSENLAKELTISLSTEVYSNLVHQALAQGCTVEALIARTVEGLSREK